MPPNEAAHTAYDRRVTELVDAFMSLSTTSRSAGGILTDPFRAAGQQRQHHAFATGPLRTGTIVFCAAHCNWYKVQLDGPGGFVGCFAAGDGSFLPIGMRPMGGLLPYSQVLVWMPPPGCPAGMIVAAFPNSQHDAGLICPDWVLQGSGAGMLREKIYQQLVSMYREGGLIHFGANRPLDTTSLEWGRIAETGVGLSIDPYLAFMRSSEVCGIWCHLMDHHLRVCGWNMDMITSAHEMMVRQDEGENRLVESHYTYPWEAVGMYAPSDSAPFHGTFEDKDVLFNRNRGTLDLVTGEEDLQPIARYQEFGGYLGQGRRRQVMVPALESGRRFRHDDAHRQPDFGVFEESIGLDGSYLLRSAKQMWFVKHSLIPIPREVQLPENQKGGDDARKGNYKFSGTFGKGEDHKVGDVSVPWSGQDQHLLSIAAVYDLLSYAFNWQNLHPFQYHKEDYVVPQESEVRNKGGPAKAQEKLDFSQLSSRLYMDYPTPKQVKVDARYGNVDYIERIGYMGFLPDASWVMGDGYGGQIASSAGSMRFDCPGDIVLAPGRNLILMGGRDIIVRSGKSVDVSAAVGDVRIKGESNVQVLSNSGGILLESKTPFVADFDNKFGEDVRSGGIMFKSPDVVTWAGNIYMRTGGGGMAAGNIILDAAKGSSSVILTASDLQVFAANGVEFWLGPANGNANTKAAYLFNGQSAVMGGAMFVGGGMFINGNVQQNGSMVNMGGFGSVSNYGYVGQERLSDFNQTLTPSLAVFPAAAKQGAVAYKEEISTYLYVPKAPGNTDVITQAGFSFRDVQDNSQYGTNFTSVLTESRWQMMARLGMGSGGQDWIEPVVHYQNRELMPWPGKANWTSKTLLGLKNLTLFDAANGLAKDRPGPYDEPELAVAYGLVPAANFKQIW